MNMLLFILLSFVPLNSRANEIALTIDDVPLGSGKLYTGRERTEKIISVLKRFNLQTMLFVNTSRLPDDQGTERVMSYSRAGHPVANHTHAHPRLREVPAQDFIKDIDRADELLKVFPTFVKWFRFPYLGEGATLESRDRVRKHLKSKEYKNGFVTVDNYDYFINDLVQSALRNGKKVHMDRACGLLVDLMWEGIRYYDTVAQKHIGKVRHVLLMHENDIEAFCLEDLITSLQTKGWKIVAPGRAFGDPLLANEPETLYLNQGRVAAIAHVKSGIKYRSPWENEEVLRVEFKKRKIVED